MSIPRKLNSKLIIKEERNASKKGLNLLKDYGLKGESFNKAKENLRDLEDTYINTSNSYVKIPILNFLRSTKKYI